MRIVRTRNEFAPIIEAYDDDGARLTTMVDEGQTDADVEALVDRDRRWRAETKARWQRRVEEEFGGDEEAARAARAASPFVQRMEAEEAVGEALHQHRQEAARLRRATDQARRNAP